MKELEEKLIKLGMKKELGYEGLYLALFGIELEVSFQDDDIMILHEGGELCSSKDSQLIYNVLHAIKQCETTG